MAASGVTYLRKPPDGLGRLRQSREPRRRDDHRVGGDGAARGRDQPGRACAGPAARRPVGFLATSSRSWSGAYALERGILAVVALRLNPAKFAGRNLIKALRHAGRARQRADRRLRQLDLLGRARAARRRASRCRCARSPTSRAASRPTAATRTCRPSPRVPTRTTPPRRSWRCTRAACRARTSTSGGRSDTCPPLTSAAAGTPCCRTARPTASPPRGRCRRGGRAASRTPRRSAWLGARHSGDGSYFYAPGNHQTPTLRHRPGAARNQRQVLSRSLANRMPPV